jgi:hypothetical protein
VPAGEFVRLAHVEQQRIGAINLKPVGHGHVSIQNVLGQHAGKVDQVFRRTELRGIAKLGLGEIMNGASKLNRGRDDIDPFLHTFETYRLRTEDAAVRL